MPPGWAGTLYATGTQLRSGWDGTSTAVAYQLTRVAGSTACSLPVPFAAARTALSVGCVHRPSRGGDTLVACHNALLLWSQMWLKLLHAINVPVELNQTAYPSGRMETPSPGGPANLESIRESPSRAVCFPGILPLPSALAPQHSDGNTIL